MLAGLVAGEAALAPRNFIPDRIVSDDPDAGFGVDGLHYPECYTELNGRDPVIACHSVQDIELPARERGRRGRIIGHMSLMPPTTGVLALRSTGGLSSGVSRSSFRYETSAFQGVQPRDRHASVP
ncbi:hypothetical protein CHELA41_22259 [Hyphomicrobiales bacterium]|nr:hypothetical protein CHELA41_22259 [Hyphomicrobiales bacterium]